MPGALGSLLDQSRGLALSCSQTDLFPHCRLHIRIHRMGGTKAEAVEPQTRQKLALYFACADAWHARMVQARTCGCDSTTWKRDETFRRANIYQSAGHCQSCSPQPALCGHWYSLNGVVQAAEAVEIQRLGWGRPSLREFSRLCSMQRTVHFCRRPEG